MRSRRSAGLFMIFLANPRQLLSGNKMTTVISKCHCGSVELELILPNGLENLRRCNDLICSGKNDV